MIIKNEEEGEIVEE